MVPKFKKIAVICRRNNRNSMDTLDYLMEYLKKQKIQVFIERETASFLAKNTVATVDANQLNKVCDLIAVVGGDGSFLSAARLAAKQNLPIVGINRGSLGFLTDITPRCIDKVGEIIRGIFYEEKRLVLKTTIANNNKKTTQNLAINDVVFLSHSTGHLIEFFVHLNGQFLCKYRANGLIVATPTGSTAHALSGGGPILYPTLENIVLVPMLSHNLSSRPIVIDGKSTIEITFIKSNATELLTICDGQLKSTLQEGKIRIRAEKRLRLLHPKEYNYFDILRTKLHWEKENKNPSAVC